MKWEEAVPQLERRLNTEGLPGPAQVVTRLPVLTYALLLFIPMALLAALILGSHPTLATAAVVIVAVSSIEATVLAWAKASVVVAGPSWVARHGLLRWHLVRLDSLRKVDRWVDKSTAWLRLWDSAGGHVSLEARSTVPRIRGLLARWVGEAQADGVPVQPAAAEMLGLPDIRTPDERHRASRRTNVAAALLTGLAVVPLLGAGPAGFLIAALLIVGVVLVVRHSNHRPVLTA
jgi:hypothetical protein